MIEPSVTAYDCSPVPPTWPEVATVSRPQPVQIRTTGPVSFAGLPAQQINGQTCGSASLAYVIALREPEINTWLAQDPGRFGVLQLRLHSDTTSALRTSKRAQNLKLKLNPATPGTFGWVHYTPAVTQRGLRLPLWPRSLGTPPWGLAQHANLRTPKRNGRRRGKWRVTWSKGDAAKIAHQAVDAVQLNPVFLYVSDNPAKNPLRLDRWAVPRHVVVLVGRTRKQVFIYEPASARVHAVPIEMFRSGTLDDAHRAAFGGWRTVVALVS